MPTENRQPKVLLIDAQPDRRAALERVVIAAGGDVTGVGTVLSALNRLASGAEVDVIFVDHEHRHSIGFRTLTRAVRPDSLDRPHTVMLLDDLGQRDRYVGVPVARFARRPARPSEAARVLEAAVRTDQRQGRRSA